MMINGRQDGILVTIIELEELDFWYRSKSWIIGRLRAHAKGRRYCYTPVGIGHDGEF